MTHGFAIIRFAAPFVSAEGHGEKSDGYTPEHQDHYYGFEGEYAPGPRVAPVEEAQGRRGLKPGAQLETPGYRR